LLLIFAQYTLTSVILQVVPFELVKIRLQDKATTFRGPIEVVKHIVKHDGVLGLYSKFCTDILIYVLCQLTLAQVEWSLLSGGGFSIAEGS
jgi:hypothetical protein